MTAKVVWRASPLPSIAHKGWSPDSIQYAIINNDAMFFYVLLAVYDRIRGETPVHESNEMSENMAALKVAVLLAVLGSVSLALQMPFSKGTFSRIRRQLPSPQCQQDYLDLSSNGCFTLLGEGTTVVTVEHAKQFCKDGCSTTLDGFFKKIIADCGQYAGVSELLS